MLVNTWHNRAVLLHEVRRLARLEIVLRSARLHALDLRHLDLLMASVLSVLLFIALLTILNPQRFLQHHVLHVAEGVEVLLEVSFAAFL